MSKYEDLDIRGAAWFSPDMEYRYCLTRSWGTTSRPRVWVLLNPSTADAEIDDPTVRRCIDFTIRDHNCSLTVVNIFAFRSTDPKVMKAQADPIGPDNDSFIRSACQDANDVVVAWGNHGVHLKRSDAVRELLAGVGTPVYALELNKNGEPKHPLYVKGDAELIRIS